MSPLLKEYLNKKVVVVTTDGHSITGVLEGYDKSVNILLSNVQNNYNPSKLVNNSSDGGTSDRSNNIISMQVCRGSEIVFCGILSEEGGEEKIEKEVGTDTLKNITQWDILKTTKNIIKDEHLIWRQVWLQRQQKENSNTTETT